MKSSIWAGDSETGMNGIALSMDERTLYVSYTNEAVVRAFPINERGDVEEGEIFAPCFQRSRRNDH